MSTGYDVIDALGCRKLSDLCIITNARAKVDVGSSLR